MAKIVGELYAKIKIDLTQFRKDMKEVQRLLKTVSQVNGKNQSVNINLNVNTKQFLKQFASVYKELTKAIQSELKIQLQNQTSNSQKELEDQKQKNRLEIIDEQRVTNEKNKQNQIELADKRKNNSLELDDSKKTNRLEIIDAQTTSNTKKEIDKRETSDAKKNNQIEVNDNKSKNQKEVIDAQSASNTKKEIDRRETQNNKKNNDIEVDNNRTKNRVIIINEQNKFNLVRSAAQSYLNAILAYNRLELASKRSTIIQERNLERQAFNERRQELNQLKGMISFGATLGVGNFGAGNLISDLIQRINPISIITTITSVISSFTRGLEVAGMAFYNFTQQAIMTNAELEMSLVQLQYLLNDSQEQMTKTFSNVVTQRIEREYVDKYGKEALSDDKMKEEIKQKVELEVNEKGLVNSVNLAQELKNQLQMLSIESPTLVFSDVMQGTTRLKNAGVAAEYLHDSIRIIGDAAAVTGKDAVLNFDKATYAIGQMYQKGAVMAEEFNRQLGNSGMATYRALTAVTGLSQASIVKLMKAGKTKQSTTLAEVAAETGVSADIISKKIEETTGRIVKANDPMQWVDLYLAGLDALVGGSMDVLANTFTGQINILIEKFKYFSSLLTKPLFEGLKEDLKALQSIIAKSLNLYGFEESAKNVFTNIKIVIADFINILLPALTDKFGKVLQGLTENGTGIAPFFRKLFVDIQTFLLNIDADTIVARIKKAIQIITDVGQTIVNIFGFIYNNFSTIISSIVAVIATVLVAGIQMFILQIAYYSKNLSLARETTNAFSNALRLQTISSKQATLAIAEQAFELNKLALAQQKVALQSAQETFTEVTTGLGEADWGEEQERAQQAVKQAEERVKTLEEQQDALQERRDIAQTDLNNAQNQSTDANTQANQRNTASQRVRTFGLGLASAAEQRATTARNTATLSTNMSTLSYARNRLQLGFWTATANVARFATIGLSYAMRGLGVAFNFLLGPWGTLIILATTLIASFVASRKAAKEFGKEVEYGALTAEEALKNVQREAQLTENSLNSTIYDREMYIDVKSSISDIDFSQLPEYDSSTHSFVGPDMRVKLSLEEATKKANQLINDINRKAGKQAEKNVDEQTGFFDRFGLTDTGEFNYDVRIKNEKIKLAQRELDKVLTDEQKKMRSIIDQLKSSKAITSEEYKNAYNYILGGGSANEIMGQLKLASSREKFRAKVQTNVNESILANDEIGKIISSYSNKELPEKTKQLLATQYSLGASFFDLLKLVPKNIQASFKKKVEALVGGKAFVDPKEGGSGGGGVGDGDTDTDTGGGGQTASESLFDKLVEELEYKKSIGKLTLQQEMDTYQSWKKLFTKNTEDEIKIRRSINTRLYGVIEEYLNEYDELAREKIERDREFGRIDEKEAIKRLESHYKALTAKRASLEKQYGFASREAEKEAKEALQDARMDLVEKELDEEYDKRLDKIKKAQEKELQAVEDFYDEKIDAIDKAIEEQRKLFDEANQERDKEELEKELDRVKGSITIEGVARRKEIEKELEQIRQDEVIAAMEKEGEIKKTALEKQKENAVSVLESQQELELQAEEDRWKKRSAMYKAEAMNINNSIGSIVKRIETESVKVRSVGAKFMEQLTNGFKSMKPLLNAEIDKLKKMLDVNTLLGEFKKGTTNLFTNPINTSKMTNPVKYYDEGMGSKYSTVAFNSPMVNIDKVVLNDKVDTQVFGAEMYNATSRAIRANGGFIRV